MKKVILILLLLICIELKASIVVMDADTGRVIYEKNKDNKMLIASTTKIMTAIVALENASLNEIYEVKDEINEVYGSMIYIKKGEKISLERLLYGLMLQSGNDASMVIATNVFGNYNKFIEKMNLKAYKLGMYNSTFENPHGLNENTKNYSTAYDMAILMKYAIKNKIFMKITGKQKYKSDIYTWYNKNKLLSNYKYSTSGKIGYTKASGQVFVSSATKSSKKLVISSINESDKFNLHEELYEKYFNLYDRYKILDKYTFSFKVNNKSYKHLYIKNDLYMLLNEEEKDKLKIDIKIYSKSNHNVSGEVLVKINEEVVHREKIYSLNYEGKKSKLKDLLLFWK